MIMQNEKEIRHFEERHKRRSVLLEILRKNYLEATATTTTTASASAASGTTATTAAPTVCLLASLVLGLGGIVNKKCVQRQAVGEDVVANGRTANVDSVEREGVTTLGGHLDSSKRGVHLRRDRSDGTVKNCAYIEAFASATLAPLRLAVGGSLEAPQVVLRSRSREVGWLHIPFLSSIVTVSFAHFIKNLVVWLADSSGREKRCSRIPARIGWTWPQYGG